MTPTSISTPTTTGGPTRRPIRQWLLVAAIAVIAAIGGAVALTDDDGSDAGDSAAPPDPAGSTLSCVEVYDLETLAHREVAFAGTVTEVADGQLTFAVERWFRGGQGATTTLTSSTGGAITPDGGPTLSVGDHLLVAGDGGFAWDCGFTQPYDEAVASQWATVFAG